MPHTLLLILLLLAASVVVVTICRNARLPPILGYLLVGIALGPHALAVVPDDAATRKLAEFGIVFLMFSIGLISTCLLAPCRPSRCEREPAPAARPLEIARNRDLRRRKSAPLRSLDGLGAWINTGQRSGFGSNVAFRTRDEARRSHP